MLCYLQYKQKQTINYSVDKNIYIINNEYYSGVLLIMLLRVISAIKRHVRGNSDMSGLVPQYLG